MSPFRASVPALAVAAFLSASIAAAEPATGSRLALVIGNGRYPFGALANPVNDARAMAGALRRAGFEVIERHDAGAPEMRRAIREFGERLAGRDAGLFYFAGHGVQVAGRNLLVPAHADIQYEDEIEDQSIDVGLVLSKMGAAKSRTNIVILDACRNNPFARSTRTPLVGLAPIEAPLGTLIAFATSPGQVASDGTGGNGLYTRFLVREMEQAGAKVEEVFKRVRAAVRRESGGRQIPWENTSLEGDFYFHLPPSAAADGRRDPGAAEEEAIRRAVAEALTRSQAEAQKERERLEAFYAKRIAEERDAAMRQAAERISALERAAAEAGRAAPATAPASAAPREEDPAQAIMLAMVPPSSPPETPEDVARGQKAPTLRVGDQWTYYREIRAGPTRRNYVTLEVVAADPERTLIAQQGAQVPFVLDREGAIVSAPTPKGPARYDPPDARRRYPLEPGTRWSAKGRASTGSLVAAVESHTTVIGWEDVVVPAGAFRGLKIVKVVNRESEPFPGRVERSKLVRTDWYVPALRAEAKTEFLEVLADGGVERDETWELDSFRLQ